MPTPIPSGEKTAFINIVKAAPYPGGPIEADRLNTLLNNYEDIIVAIMRQLTLFASNNQYLTQAIGVFDDPSLQNVLIFNNKTVNNLTTVTDWAMLINCTVDGTLRLTTSFPGYVALTILGTTKVANLDIDATLNVQEIYIGPSCTVGFLDGTASGVVINTIWLPFIKSSPSNLLAIANGTIVNQIVLDEGSYFGGFREDTQSSCASPVTNLAYGVITYNSIQLMWTAPASPYLFINIYFKQTGTQSWDKADETIGSYAENGYTFTKLAANTSFDFKVEVICLNGGHADTLTTVQTTAQ